MRFLFLAAMLMHGSSVFANDDFAEHLAACAACHGEHGEGVRGAEYYPHLAGKPAGYLFEQLKGFRDGLRSNTQMTWFVQYADDAFLRAIAAYYAALPPRVRAADAATTPMQPSQQALAEKLVREGDRARSLSACAQCHGADLAGLEPGVPALVALPADYISAQFGSWRSNVRQSAPPDCMREIARALSPEEITAVAAWLARQSNAAGSRPAAAGSFAPPRECGALSAAENGS